MRSPPNHSANVFSQGCGQRAWPGRLRLSPFVSRRGGAEYLELAQGAGRVSVPLSSSSSRDLLARRTCPPAQSHSMRCGMFPRETCP